MCSRNCFGVLRSQGWVCIDMYCSCTYQFFICLFLDKCVQEYHLYAAPVQTVRQSGSNEVEDIGVVLEGQAVLVDLPSVGVAVAWTTLLNSSTLWGDTEVKGKQGFQSAFLPWLKSTTPAVFSPQSVILKRRQIWRVAQLHQLSSVLLQPVFMISVR